MGALAMGPEEVDIGRGEAGDLGERECGMSEDGVESLDETLEPGFDGLVAEEIRLVFEGDFVLLRP